MSVGEIKNKINVSVGQVNFENNIENLSKAIENQSRIISELQNEIRESGHWKSKMKDYFIGGVIGAILGLLATLLAGIG
jgi:gas vesicle protein